MNKELEEKEYIEFDLSCDKCVKRRNKELEKRCPYGFTGSDLKRRQQEVYEHNVKVWESARDKEVERLSLAGMNSSPLLEHIERALLKYEISKIESKLQSFL